MPTILKIRGAVKEDLDSDRNTVATVRIGRSKRGPTVAEVRELIGKYSYKAFPVVDAEGVAIGIAQRCLLEELVRDESDDQKRVDVGSVTDPYPMMVRPDFPMRSAYDLFKRMEMRQLVVVDDAHHPQAVLTRKTLLPWVVEERIAERRGAAGAQDRIRRRSSGMRRPEGMALEMAGSYLESGREL